MAEELKSAGFYRAALSNAADLAVDAREILQSATRERSPLEAIAEAEAKLKQLVYDVLEVLGPQTDPRML